MQGQWLGKITGELPGSLRIELEDRGSEFFGHGYVFYDEGQQLPGFSFELRIPKSPPHVVQTTTIYLYSNGGVMTTERRTESEMSLAKRFEGSMPESLTVEFTRVGDDLQVDWRAPDGRSGSELVSQSDLEGKSNIAAEARLATWDQVREWAVDQNPRKYIFRSQVRPFKLASTFHRSWRSDLASWISNDVSLLFGAVIEKINYPLQLGQLEHNSAIWSILQHHGYPTPMLDWTYSPFVAAYFAFQNAEVVQDEPPRIFMFDQSAWNERYARQAFIVDPAPPQLVVLESLQIGNPRSGPQQAISTVTNIADVEAFIKEREDNDGRSYLTVCDLPAHDKPRIMRELELMGITYGSLFPGLDGTCRDMKERLFRHPS